MTDPFPLDCSALPFGADAYRILTRQGYRLQRLLDRAEPPRDLAERYFVDCIERDADYDSHQCLEAEAWRKRAERKEYERKNPPPGPGRTWVRGRELRGGMILPQPGGRFLLVGDERRGELSGRGSPVRFRLAPDLPWHDADLTGRWHLVTDVRSGERGERFVRYDAELEAVDEPAREMSFVWWNGPDDDMLIHDAETNEVYHVPPDRVSSDFLEGGPVHSYSLVRVQWWAGRPLWVWGAL